MVTGTHFGPANRTGNKDNRGETRMPRRKPSSAGAFFTMARAYADAANALMIADASPSPLSSSPIYFLYSHTAQSSPSRHS